MRALLLNPPSLDGTIFMKEIGRCGRKTVAGEVWPQTGLAYLAAALLQGGHECKIIDAMATPIAEDELVAEMRGFAPQLVVLSTATPTFNNDAEVSRILKDAGAPFVVFVGTHVSVLPEKSLEESAADCIIINEGEQTICELAQQIEQGKKSLENIPGLCVRRDGEVRRTEPREFVEDLDALPFPARHLLPNERYRTPFSQGRPFATIIPSRGCPYKCIFCRAGDVWGSAVRVRSPENVCAEIRDMVERLGIKDFAFMTDSFTLRRDWAIELCNLIMDDPVLGGNVRWMCNSRVDAADLEMLRAMKSAGCFIVSYGVESADEEILERSKKKITPEQSRRAIELTREAGLLSFAYFVLGLPGETHETIEKSIHFAKETSPDYVNFHIATPFPGTELYEMAKQNGWLTTEDWSEYEEEGSAVMRTEALTAEELQQAQRRAMNAFYLRPKQLWRELMRVKTFTDFKIRVKAGLKLIAGLATR